jgi:hypothetical protein
MQPFDVKAVQRVDEGCPMSSPIAESVWLVGYCVHDSGVVEILNGIVYRVSLLQLVSTQLGALAIGETWFDRKRSPLHCQCHSMQKDTSRETPRCTILL